MTRQQVANQMQGPDTQRPNLLQNGGFEVWGSHGPFTGNGDIIADAWTTNFDEVTDTLSITRDTANADPPGSIACAAITLTKVSAANALFFQSLNHGALAGRTVSYSIRIKTATPGAILCSLFHDGGDTGISVEHTGSGEYETLSGTTVIPLVVTSVSFRVFLMASCMAYVDNAVLVIGEVPTEYVPAISYPDAIPNARLGPSVARANLLTNGGFEVWQRGPGPFPSGVANSWAADRWRANISDVLTTWSISRVPGIGSQYGAGVTFALNGGAWMQLIQHLNLADGGIAAELAGGSVSFSVDVICDQPNALRAGIQYDGGFTYSPFHSGGGVVQRLHVSLPIPAGATTVQGYVSFEGDCNATLDNAMLVVGEVPADYAPLHPADEVARCFRYYESAHTQSTGYGGVTPGAHSLDTVSVVRKAVTPSTTLANVAYAGSAGPSGLTLTPGLTGIQPTVVTAAEGSIFTAYDWTAEANP